MGGTGKSSLSIVEALAMTSGKALLGAAVPRPLRVVLVNLEDSRNTMDKRIAAVMRFYGLTPADIGDRLIVKAKGEIKIKVAQLSRSGEVVRNRPIITALIKLMLDHHQADVLSIDSFVRTHEVNENDNSAMLEVVECFEEIALGGQLRGASVAPHPQGQQLESRSRWRPPAGPGRSPTPSAPIACSRP